MNDQAKILIIDDDLVAGGTLVDRLTAENYHSVLFSSGYEALEKIADIQPDLLLLDVMMPGMNGFEVCRRLRNSAEWRHIPIILVTALDSSQDLIDGLNAGADEFLTKPIQWPEMRARVRSMLRIKQQYDELQKVLQLREDLVHMMVHDMRNILTTIALHNGLVLQRNQLTTKDATALKTVHTQVHQLESFINDMLLMAKMSENKLILTYSEVDMKQVILRGQNDYELMAQAASCDFVLDLPVEAKTLFLDVNLISRMIDNLLSNAFKFSPAKGVVRLQLSYPEPKNGKPLLCLKVFDEGPGVAEVYRRRIFQRYETLQLKKEGISQTGLGLALCHLVATAHGGTIYVEDNLPKGSVFVVEI